MPSMSDQCPPADARADAPPLPPRRKRERDANEDKEEERVETPEAAAKKVRGDEADAPKPAQPTFASFAQSKNAFAKGTADADTPKEAKDAGSSRARVEEATEKSAPPSSDAAPVTEAAPAPNTAAAPVAEAAESTKTNAPASEAAPAPTSTPAATEPAAPTTAAAAPTAAPAASAAPASTAPTPSKSGPSLGFGAFAARSEPFKAATALSEKAEAAEADATNWTKTETEAAPPQPDAEDIVVRKRSIRKPDAELPTGEEEERTVASTRAKLYTMAKDQSWKERGTGVLKINLRAEGSESESARLGTWAMGLTQ